MFKSSPTRWWMAATLASLSITLIAGCLGDGPPPSGNPTVPTPIPTTTGTPSATPISSEIVGNYAGTFSLASFNEVSRRLTLTVNGDGSVTGVVSLSSGGILELTGSVNATNNVSLQGQAVEVGSNQEFTVFLDGRITPGQSGFVNGGGTVRTTQGDNGIWQVQLVR